MAIQKKLNKSANLFWLVCVIAFTLYGLLAFNSGLTVNRYNQNFSANDPIAIQKIKKIRQLAQAGQPIPQADLAMHIPEWMRVMAAVNGQKFAYGDGGIVDGAITNYIHASKTNRSIIGVHMMLGMVLMFCGTMQFWPVIRKKWPKLHRILGAVYIATAVVSMSSSMYHLVVNGPSHTFSGFVFFFGLWLLAMGSLTAIALASYYIAVPKNVLLHMGWQSIGFAFFLTAPIQRTDWMFLSYFFSSKMTFMEFNTLVNLILLMQAALFGYLIFLFNRNTLTSYFTLKNPSGSLQASIYNRPKLLQKITWAVLGTLAIATVYKFMVSPGLFNNAVAVATAPEQLVALDAQLYQHMVLPVLYTFAVLTLLAACVVWFKNRNTFIAKKLAVVLFASSAVLVAIQLYWGYQIGLPNKAVGVGGAFYSYNALLLALFTVLALWALRTKRYAFFNEQLRFMLAYVFAPTLAYGFIGLVHALGFTPAQYIASGDEFLIAIITALFIPTMVAIVYALYDKPVKAS